ncbi:hypothetical protein GCM10010276_77290 [Streptomyces longisporus]|uniref:Uncharacterized protein n=1 Tax=Streptomyces longisporus TaxID=1948 RepID=A0ABP6AIN3_STRLO
MRPRRPYPSRPQGLPPLRPHQGLRPWAPAGTASLAPTAGLRLSQRARVPCTPAGLRLHPGGARVP